MRSLFVLTLLVLVQLLPTEGVNIGVNCTSGADCPSHGVCSSNTSLCACGPGYVSSSNKTTCIADGQLNGKCSANIACVVVNTMCSNISQKCVCQAAFIEYNGICVADGQLNGACKASSVCDAANTQCTNTKCLCKTGYAESNGQCMIKAGYLTGTCADTGACTTNEANSQCTDNKCECKTGYTANGIVCAAIADGALNGRCKTAAPVCDTTNAACSSGYCKCSAGFAESAGKCSGAENVISSLALILVSVVTSRFL